MKIKNARMSAGKLALFLASFFVSLASAWYYATAKSGGK